jgi:hypothetical protein
VDDMDGMDHMDKRPRVLPTAREVADYENEYAGLS